MVSQRNLVFVTLDIPKSSKGTYSYTIKVSKFAEMLAELLRREKELKIKPDPDIDVYMKVRNYKEKNVFMVELSFSSSILLKLLNIEICYTSNRFML